MQIVQQPGYWLERFRRNVPCFIRRAFEEGKEWSGFWGAFLNIAIQKQEHGNEESNAAPRAELSKGHWPLALLTGTWSLTAPVRASIGMTGLRYALPHSKLLFPHYETTHPKPTKILTANLQAFWTCLQVSLGVEHVWFSKWHLGSPFGRDGILSSQYFFGKNNVCSYKTYGTRLAFFSSA